MFYWTLVIKVQMNGLNIDYFRLVSNFSRNHSTSGGSYIYKRNTIETKEVNYLRELGIEKVFELQGGSNMTGNDWQLWFKKMV